MNVTELANLVAEMRHAQKDYFRTMSTSALEESKRLENRVYTACREILDGQKKMFDE